MRSRIVTTAAIVALLLPAVPADAASRNGFRDATASRETPSLYDDAPGGEADADDPAIWVHPRRPAGSLVLGTAKNAGLRVYDLAGRERQAIAPPPGGRFNNVDLVRGFRLGGRAVDLAVVTDRGLDRLRFYRIDPDAAAPLVDVTAAGVPLVFSADESEVDDQNTAYGLATYTAGAKAFAIVSQRNRTRLGRIAIRATGDRVTYVRQDIMELPATFTLPDGTTWTPCGEPGEAPQVEGMVVDGDILYAAQEDVGLWRIPLDGGRRTVVENVREYGIPATYDPATEECTVHHDRDPGFGGRIAADVEGLTLHTRHLLVSSQGDNRFYAYDRRTGAPAGHFRILDGAAADGVQHSDGAAAVGTPLPGFPAGLLVLHDGENTPSTGRPDTNFKYVDWRSVTR